MDSEAKILWEDVIVLLKEKSFGPSNIAMLESCTPERLEDDAITVSTKIGFAKHNIEKNKAIIEKCLEEAAFSPISLKVILERDRGNATIDTHSDLTAEELNEWQKKTSSPITPLKMNSVDIPPSRSEEEEERLATQRRRSNPLVEEVSNNDSQLTFDTFVEGEENHMALQAAKQVANGINRNFNPLFIYGRSGVGKTHLLKAIWNYINSNDLSRLCVYKTSREFLDDYMAALRNREKDQNAFSNLDQQYKDIDVLIVDDFQWLTERERTLEYFFDIFNYLKDRDKQIVIAADRQPNQLSGKEKRVDERLTSRVGGGFTIAIQIPDYELKLALIKNFYRRTKEEAAVEEIPGYEGVISDDLLELMAERSGTNIRTIKTYCQKCLITSTEKMKAGGELSKEDISKLAKECFYPYEQKTVTIEEIQKAVESDYKINHKDLIGNKRNKELMEPRHVAIWLSRNLTDYTLADIGDHFGGRSHATVKHSIEWVDKLNKDDRVFHDRVMRIRESINEL